MDTIDTNIALVEHKVIESCRRSHSQCNKWANNRFQPMSSWLWPKLFGRQSMWSFAKRKHHFMTWLRLKFRSFSKRQFERINSTCNLFDADSKSVMRNIFSKKCQLTTGPGKFCTISDYNWMVRTSNDSKPLQWLADITD